METAEHRRLLGYRRRESNWKLWGPYLSERAWGTVREDYGNDGSPWEYFPHDHARSRAYRWNEDGLAGICDRNQHVCFALALWNGRDPILKERLFGLSGPEGNHGEDVKENYYFLDSTPTHSYMKILYKYPQREFPYRELVEENHRRGLEQDEYELLDTGVFDEDRYFDVVVEYAKADERDILVRITATNRGPDKARLTVLPTLWFRNTWSWGYEAGPQADVPEPPRLRLRYDRGERFVAAVHPAAGRYELHAEHASEWLFTDNETHNERHFGAPNRNRFVKDAFHRYVIQDETSAVNPAREGTKAAAVYDGAIAAHGDQVVRLRLTGAPGPASFRDFDELFERRKAEADDFYASIQRSDSSPEERAIQRQAFAGMLWSKQLYYYDVEQWLDGDPAYPPPPPSRKKGRNADWRHLHNFDLLSMPDTWEYPWYAAWDLAFHTVALVLVDPDFAKRQLELITREWYLHPSGALPAYEWALGDANPPVHAWAALRVYQMDAKQHNVADVGFLRRVFHKLLLNFTWWVNRKDTSGDNVFQGGFLGLDNISLFDRSLAPGRGHLDQSDGTAWMAFYSLEMMKIALELSRDEPAYQDLATKFFEHFLAIARAMSDCGGTGHSLWDPVDGFFYDALHLPDGPIQPIKARSLVGLIPLLAVEPLEPEFLEEMPVFARRMRWFLEYRPHLAGNIASLDVPGAGRRHLAAILPRDRLVSVLRYLLDENEFLSPFGIRSLSKVHGDEPFGLTIDGEHFNVRYEPGESRTHLFGGNSNWRGPIWFPLNFLIIEALQRFHHYYGDDFRIECPTGSTRLATLSEVAAELSTRLVRLFKTDGEGRRPIHGRAEKHQTDPHFRNHLLFHEFFHGETGVGLGASHQTGWTALVANLIQQCGD